MFAVNKITYQGSTMVNICDQELVGTKISDGKLEIKLTKEYFGQNLVNEDEAIHLLNSCFIANLVGRRIVNQALRMKIAFDPSVRTISDIPFLMIYRFQHGY